MIGLDTNVLVRYIVQDDPEQSALATTFIESRCTTDSPGFVNNVVLVELVWVLERGYSYPKSAILSVLKQLVVTAELKLEHSDSVREAVRLYEMGSAGFADCLIAALNRQYGCSMTMTFDRRAGKHPDFALILELPE